ncbi:hypothetical protein GW17_00053728 [Ensete ventricosum]|nr:hypothetical protein GW17_00053728 [Ensete ventricosum]
MARGRPMGDEGAQARTMVSLQSILWNTFVRRRSDGREQEEGIPFCSDGHGSTIHRNGNKGPSSIYREVLLSSISLAERRTARSKGCWRFICCWSRSGSHPLSVLVESLLLDSGEGDCSHHGAGLPHFNLSFNFRLESFDECP